MTNKPPPFKGLNIRIPGIIPIEGRGLINQGSGSTLNPKPSAQTFTKPCALIASRRAHKAMALIWGGSQHRRIGGSTCDPGGYLGSLMSL